MCRRSCGACHALPRVYLYRNAELEAVIGSAVLDKAIAGVTEPWVRAPTSTRNLVPLIYRRLKAVSVAADQADFFVSFQTPYEPPYHNHTEEDQLAMRAMGPVRPELFGNQDQLSMLTACREWESW